MDLKVDCDTKEHKSQITSSSVCELINLLRCIQSLSHTNQELSSESFKRFLFLLQSCGMKQNCSEESLSENVTFSELEANLKYILEKVPPLSSFLRAHVTFQPLYMEQLSLTTTAQNLTPVVRFFDNFHVNIFRENQFLWSSSAIHTVPNQCFGIDYDSIDFITLGPSTQFVHIVLKKDAFVFHNSLPIAANALSFRNTEIFPTSVFQSFFTQTINTVDKLCTLDTSCNIVSQQKFETLEVNIIEVPKKVSKRQIFCDQTKFVSSASTLIRQSLMPIYIAIKEYLLSDEQPDLLCMEHPSSTVSMRVEIDGTPILRFVSPCIFPIDQKLLLDKIPLYCIEWNLLCDFSQSSTLQKVQPDTTSHSSSISEIQERCSIS